MASWASWGSRNLILLQAVMPGLETPGWERATDPEAAL